MVFFFTVYYISSGQTNFLPGLLQVQWEFFIGTCFMQHITGLDYRKYVKLRHVN